MFYERHLIELGKGGELAAELPVPMVGLRAAEPLTDRLHLVGSLLGGYLPRVDSLRTEGGDVKLSQRHVDLDVGVEYLVTSSLSAEAGYRFSHFAQHETSREDGNDFALRDNALTFGVAYRF